MTFTIQSHSEKEWRLAEDKQSRLVQEIAKRTNISEAVVRRYQRHNAEALLAFQNRKADGLSLSDRVWKYSEQFKKEIELGLDLGLGEGKSAAQLSRDLRSYLNDPDKLFRRVRDKHGNLTLSKNAKDYHPGQGVYRSSYKNAMRLTRSENNTAYHEANYLKYQEFDFVIGIEVRLSNNPHHCPFCAEMAGKYPKDFKFTGWHPQCRCTTVPILKTWAEMDKDNERIAQGLEPLPSKNEVKEVHKPLREWVEKNQDKIKRAKVKPFWVQNNRGYIWGKQDVIKQKIDLYKSLKPKRINTNILFSDITGGVVSTGIKGISQAINYYNKLETNAEKVSLIKSITQMKEFREIRRLSNVKNKIYGFNIEQYDEALKATEMPKNITIAKKLIQNGYDVYLLPNVSGAKSADFIIVKSNKYFYYEGKTINGKSTIKQRLIEASTQSDRIILDIVGTNDIGDIADNIQWFFENNSSVNEVMLFKGSRPIPMIRQDVLSKKFKENFRDIWVGKSKKNKRF